MLHTPNAQAEPRRNVPNLYRRSLAYLRPRKFAGTFTNFRLTVQHVLSALPVLGYRHAAFFKTAPSGRMPRSE